MRLRVAASALVPTVEAQRPSEVRGDVDLSMPWENVIASSFDQVCYSQDDSCTFTTQLHCD
ncbi:MAG: hypothetical protein SFX73_15975 [Kofleriaceae bacterium]|nr:hypothetical protein [Kofleriaceae bacterium]